MLQGLLDLRNAYDTNIAAYDQGNRKYDRSQSRDPADDQLVVASSDLITKQMRLDLANQADSTYYAQLDASIANEVAADTTEVGGST
jgi:hypothetical protein